MDDDLLATRLAQRWRTPIAGVGAASAVATVANLLRWVPDTIAVCAAIGVAATAAIIFCSATFDGRFHNALSVMSAERRAQWRQLPLTTRFFGVGLPAGDRTLFIVSLLLLFVTMAAGYARHLSAAGIGFAAFFLVGSAQIALMVRGYPADHFVTYL